MPVPDATKGRYRAILERLDTWVETALDIANYVEYYVTDDYTNLPTNLGMMPYVSIKLDTGRLADETYDRYLLKDGSPDTQGQGSMVTYFFTLHVYHIKNTAPGENENRDVHIVTRIIMDYFRGRDQHATEKVSYGIERVYDVSARESDAPGFRNLKRMIVSGYLWVKRLDSP